MGHHGSGMHQETFTNHSGASQKGQKVAKEQKYPKIVSAVFSKKKVK
jgi:hypothetical protein